MTDSLDRIARGEKGAPISPELRARLATYPAPSEKTEFEQLPTWVRTACAMHELMGLTWEAVHKRTGKNPAAIKRYRSSPAYQEWREELKKAASDPRMMAEIMLKSSALGVTVEYLAAFEKSIDASDYQTTGKMAQDLLDRIGVTRKASKEATPTIVVNLGSTSLEIPMGDSRVHLPEEIPEASFEVLGRGE